MQAPPPTHHTDVPGFTSGSLFTAFQPKIGGVTETEVPHFLQMQSLPPESPQSQIGLKTTMAFAGGRREKASLGMTWDSTGEGGPTTKITPQGEEAAEQNESWSKS